MKHPNQDFENAARAAGASVLCIWQRKGGKDVPFAWLECLLVRPKVGANEELVLVETMRNTDAVFLFTGLHSTTDAALAALGIEPAADLLDAVKDLRARRMAL